MRVTKQLIIELLASMPDGPARQALIEKMVRRGELTEADLADLIVAEVNRQAPRYAEAFRTNELLQFLWHRFKDAPEYLARALVRAAPQLFWHYGFAFRMVLKLRADLGPVFIAPRRGHGGSGRYPVQDLDQTIARDIFALDVEHTTRVYLYFFSRDAIVAQEILEQDRVNAEEYEGAVLDEVARMYNHLLTMHFPGVITELNGNLFPAVHVRWWIEKARAKARLLNIGDTSTYKTSFGFVGLESVGAQHALVLCAANARENHAREAKLYFAGDGDRVQVLRSHAELADLTRNFEDHRFHIVAWTSLAEQKVVRTLLDLPFDALFADEVQYGKTVVGTHPAQRAQAFLELGRKKGLQWVWGCSATPWENRPEELAAVASLIRPDLFPEPERFAHSDLVEMPRILREIFAENVIDVDVREVRDLPRIEPKPWIDLFGAQPVEMNPSHRRVYALLREDASKRRAPSEKTRLLLKTAIHPTMVKDEFPWPPDLRERLHDWRLSSKLVWLKRFIDERIERAKIVVGSGMLMTGLTREGEKDVAWVGALLKEWYGEDRVLVIDGSVPIGPKRDALVAQWKGNPKIRVLLISMLAFPDSINLSVPKMAGVDELWVVAFMAGWKPWKQFLMRFWREGLGVPMHYTTPILPDTIEDDLLRYHQEKWDTQLLFRAAVPLTESEWEFFESARGGVGLREVTRSSHENVNFIGNQMQGGGEVVCGDLFRRSYGALTRAEVFARDFVAVQSGSASFNIARFMAKAIDAMREAEMLDATRILDAGCGPATLARAASLPVVGIDMNPFMIEQARRLTPELAVHTSEGRLSELSSDWSGKFLLSVCSLVLDWTSLVAQVDAVSERVHILRELVRITHLQGHLWFTFTEPMMNEDIFADWCRVFTENRFAILKHLTGRVEATDGPKGFAFWSIVVSPDGHALTKVDPNALRLSFELGHMKMRVRRRKAKIVRRPERVAYPHEHFRVESVEEGGHINDETAVRSAIESEVGRWARVVGAGREVGRRAKVRRDLLKGMDWRVLERLVALGILQM